MIPDLQHVVQQVRDSKTWPFRSKEQLCAYTQACIKALHAADANFGNLVKSEGQNHCKDSQDRRHAVDVTLWKPTGQIVDFIASADFQPDPDLPEPENNVAWTVGPEGEYPESSWFAPEAGGVPPVDPPVDPVPNPLEARVAVLEAQIASANLAILRNAERMEAINTRFDDESKQNVKKPLPDYVGSVRIFGFNIRVVSKPQ